MYKNIGNNIKNIVVEHDVYLLFFATKLSKEFNNKND